MSLLPFTLISADGIPALITITRATETIRFTTYESAVTIGGITWPSAPGVDLTNVVFPSDGSPSNADVKIMAVPGGAILPGDVTRGTLDGWPIQIEIFDTGDLGSGTFPILPGATIGNVTEDTRGLITITCNGPLSRATGPLTEHFTLTGREDLGDDRCKIPIRPADIGRGVEFVLPSISTGLLQVNDAYGRVRTGVAGTVEDYANVYFECTVAGTTDATTAPTYDATVGNSTVDGTATFVARNSWLRYARGQSTGDFAITLTTIADSRASDATWFGPGGGIYVCSGPLSGFRKIPVRAWDPNTLTITTFLPVSTIDIPTNTQLEIHAACDMTRGMCFSRFNNITNLRAETFVPPTNALPGDY